MEPGIFLPNFRSFLFFSFFSFTRPRHARGERTRFPSQVQIGAPPFNPKGSKGLCYAEGPPGGPDQAYMPNYT